MDYNIRRFVEIVKYLVNRSGQQIGAFEEEIGLSKSSLARIADGERPLKCETMIRISDALHLNIDDIFFYDTSADELEDLKMEQEKLTERVNAIKEEIERREHGI